MSIYPDRFVRCQHIKVNGIQCGSPALRNHKYCYFHRDWRAKRLQINRNALRLQQNVVLPVFEDANSIQVALMQVTRLLITQQIEHRTAALLLYALQTASSNLKRCTLEPPLPTTVVIDRDSVARRPIGATAWSKEEDREYDAVPSERKKSDSDEYDDDDSGEPDGSLTRTLLERLGLPSDIPREREEEDD